MPFTMRPTSSRISRFSDTTVSGEAEPGAAAAMSCARPDSGDHETVTTTISARTTARTWARDIPFECRVPRSIWQIGRRLAPMMNRRMPGLKTRPPLFFACLLLVAVVALPSAQTTPQVSPSLFQEMKWRNIGPFRAGRTKAAAGHRSQPFTFYIGMVNGGVWKTTDAGRTWKPIFEDQPTGSIGTIAVAPSDANVVYVGTGEGLPRPDLAVGDGMYKSTDAGKTWTHLGLRDAQQIPKIAVDPTDPNRLFVAALGHPYGPNKERGIFRSTDGGRTFQHVLFKNEDTGGKDVDIDPANPQIVYATMWEQRQGPWENGAWSGMNGGLFKSTDGGMTWTQMKQGLPDGVINAELAIAPSNPRRLYVTLEAGAGGTGLYRSDDAGATWARATTDNRPTSRINEVVPHVHPKDA